MAKLLKDLYNESYVENIGKKVQSNYQKFNLEAFKKGVFSKIWIDLELKGRMRHIAVTLGEFLSSDYTHSLSILEKVFKTLDTQQALENMVFQDFVEIYGMENFESSMKALEIFTIGSSSEFAIRQFILKYPDQTMKQMQKWAKSNNEHVRRLASEGCRTRLPWAIALEVFKKDPSEILKILECLKDDESAYVRKSVANSINDISKDNPKIVIALLKKWIGYSVQRDKMLKHGSRTLLKSSNVEVLELFGIKKATHVELKIVQKMQEVVLGEDLIFSFVLSSNKALGYLRVEYEMEFLRQNQKRTKKMFKICEGNYEKNTKTIEKKHSFKPISSRKYYEGIQKINLYINGEIFNSFEFKLVTII